MTLKDKLLRYAVKNCKKITVDNTTELSGDLVEVNYTEQEIKLQWLKIAPHFGNIMPHRYQAMASDFIKLGKNDKDCKVCVYCLKPQEK